MKKHDIVIIGAGPSGLAAATEATKKTTSIKIFEKSKNIGGLARSENFKGCIFDVGPHRFYTLNSEINNFFRHNIKKDSIEVKRLTRIFYDKKYFYYPLSPFNTLLNLGIVKAIKILSSYFYSKCNLIFNYSKVKNFEDWVILN